MIDIDQSHPEFVILHPEGALSKADFAELTKAIDTRINETDRVPNLVICLEKVPHWDSIGALASHFNFVKVHQKVVKKVAVVGDSPLLSVAPEIANFFVSATVRRFPSHKLEDAKAWAAATEDDPGHFETIDGLPRDVVAVRAVGIITGEDYREMLLPLVQEKLKEHDKLKCLFVLDHDYTAYTGSAAWEDTKFDLALLRDFTRVAVVTDVEWMVKAFRLFGPLMPYDFRLFGLAELEEAKGWIKR
ncbi:SpoIIAA family protein [Parerythrobacter aestuarii]|uniref:STAS/SEC14 domain-containing protein n=1 Tax=Parerythrobacter aestuarii TaxID=3020909 RepID=UPI0024DE8CF5|nr:STAS/SEC14 domain-containing protein [Parerythrobacter aestuarii]